MTASGDAPASARVTVAMLAALQAFDAAFRLGGFKAAAAALHLTDSAVSHRIRKLEARLGERLFERRRRRIEPTKAGEALAALTGRAFLELARAMDQGADPARRGRLKVSVFPLFGSAWLLPRMADFIARHPEIELSISMSTRLADLDGEAVDAVVRSGSGDWPGLVATPLMRLRTTPLASPHLAVDLGLTSLERLRYATLIQMTRFPDAWPNWFASQGLDFAKPARTVWVEGFEAAMLAAERGAGIALSLWPLCASSIAAGRLVEAPPIRADAGTCWLAHRVDDATHPPLKAFKAWLKAALEADGLSAL